MLSSQTKIKRQFTQTTDPEPRITHYAFQITVKPSSTLSNNPGAAPQAGVQSFRSRFTPLTYIPVGEIDIETCEQCGGTRRRDRLRRGPRSRETQS